MDGIFMGKLIKFVLCILAIAFAMDMVAVAKEKRVLQQGLIRLHVVASSDSEEDQQVKLQVRDAVVAYVEEAMRHVMTVDEAKAWLQENLPGIEAAANDMLRKLGLSHKAKVSFQQEAFDVRHYDSFSLPSGVYDSLRVTIGEGQGRNWWCVVFPSLCLPAAGETVEDVAAGAGFPDDLTNTLTNRQNYKLRFYFLDLFGKLENFLFGR